jgi:hypothetical protein
MIRPAFALLVLAVVQAGEALPIVRPAAWAVAFGLLGVALAYLAASPAPFGRRATGGHAAWAWPINWSNFVGLAVAWRIWRRLTREDPWNEVADGVVVGRRLIEADRRAFEPEGPWAVLDCTSELAEPRVLREQAAYLALPSLDGFPPSGAQLRQAVAWMDTQAAAGRRLYVHCAVGHGRSATVAAAWLLHRGDFEDVDACLAAMTARRRWISLRAVQRDALRRFVESAARGVRG